MPEAKKHCLVREAKTIMPYVEKALDKLGMQGKKVRPELYGNRIFVDDILVDIQSNKVFRHGYQQLHGESAINIFGYALPYFKPKQARIREGPLDRVMITTGHELGHLFTPDLLLGVEEEAKAYAFECAWCKAIQDDNIANLKNTMRRPLFLPSKRAELFVESLIQKGHEPLQLYWDIANDKGVFDYVGDKKFNHVI